MSHQIALAFEDGVTRFIRCEEDQTVADASYRARINIPLDCRDGACGTCKAFCESGEYDGGTYIDDALTAGEAEQGFVLPCSMKPRSDLVLQIASTSAVAKTSAASYTATVSGLKRLSLTTYALELIIANRSALAFLPGQYVNLHVPGTDQIRSYSFSNSPASAGLSFLMKLTPGGAMSGYLAERAAVGDTIEFTGPNGSFFLREGSLPVLLLAGGTGLAPVLSILRQLRDEGSQRPVHLVYGVSTDDDLIEMDTLQELADDLGLTWSHCVVDPASRAEHIGYVTGLIGEEQHRHGAVAVYLCGPPRMVEAVRTYFTEQGIEPAGFYFEKFALSASVNGALAAVAPAVAAAPPAVEAVAPVIPVIVIPAPIVAVPPVPVPLAPVDVPVRAATAASGSDHGLNRSATVSARSIAGQLVFQPLPPLVAAGTTARLPADEASTQRGIAGQLMFSGRGAGTGKLDRFSAVQFPTGARGIAGQIMFGYRADLKPLEDSALRREIERDLADLATAGPVTSGPEGPAIPAAAVTTTTGHPGGSADGYQIGEEHPSIARTDDIFEARMALELGALDLTVGRMTAPQLAGYRLLAESTLPYLDGDRFVDASSFTEANAAFHDYLLAQTGNEHLVKAYQSLGVKGRMAEVLRNATWVHPRCATDHVEIVEAFERSDRDAARRLITEHSERSKLTMRRAMEETERHRRPAFVTAGRFAGKVVIVTGAAQGIGECTARRISAEGGLLVLADRSEFVREVASSLAEQGEDTLAVLADLETWEGASRVVEMAMDRFGRIDVAIHAVGGTIWQKPFAQYPPEQIQAEINRSLFPTLWGCRAVAPHMINQGYGTIVNVSSTATRGIHRVPYSAAKGGVNAITASLALELAPHGIRVAATAPGGTNAPPRRIPRGPAALTSQEQEWQRETVAQVVDFTLVKRYGSLDEQASAITFLASDEASYITGTVLPVAGGDLG